LADIKIDEILEKIKYLVCCKKNYELSDHAVEYIKNGNSSFEGIKNCIREADTVHEIKKDPYKDSVNDRIYTIKGKNHLGINFYTTGKIIKNNDEQKIYFIITAHTTE